MAKQGNGYLGGFSGKLGPAVGYMWNGKWCVRARPQQVRNPRSAKQMESRLLFKQEVQLAASMGRAVGIGLTPAARAAGMTAYNLFVSVNQQAFSLEEGALAVDYSLLTVSAGPVAPVAFGTPAAEAGNVLRVSFEKNPMHLRANKFDRVHLYVYCPEIAKGYLALAVYRMDGEVAAVLPAYFADREVVVYGFVQDEQGRCSVSQFVGAVTLTPERSEGVVAETVVETAAEVAVATAPQAAADVVAQPMETGAAAAAPVEDPPNDNPLQLSLW